MTRKNNPFDRIAEDPEIRSGTEKLAERDGILGACARICLAIADGERPKDEDCREAGLETLIKLYDEGGESS